MDTIYKFQPKEPTIVNIGDAIDSVNEKLKECRICKPLKSGVRDVKYCPVCGKKVKEDDMG